MENLTGFAEACYNDCTIEMLEEALKIGVDKTELQNMEYHGTGMGRSH